MDRLLNFQTIAADRRAETSDHMQSEIVAFLARLLTINHPAPSDRIVRKLTADETRSIQDHVMPGEGPRDFASVLQEVSVVFDNCMQLTHPHCFAYIPACPDPVASLGDILTSVYNVNAASWDVSSGPSMIEQAMITWLGAQLGLPVSVEGIFVSGGSMANMAAIVAARDAILAPMQRTDAVIYVSDQTHISILKALHITGFMGHQVRKIRTDDNFRIDVNLLRQTITTDREAGRVPFLLVANCGSTNSGSIDPLHTLADIARDEKLWLHVDGAYGASIALSDKHRYLIDGIGRADSVSWDGHKWLFQTYGCGILLTRHVDALKHSFAMNAEYLSGSLAGQGTTDFYKLGPELSRPARAISLWLTLRVLGRCRVGEMIDQGFLLARTAADGICGRENWVLAAPIVASIVLFQYTPFGFSRKDLDTLNMKISQRLLAENIAAIRTTKVRGQTALRMCAMNPLTKPETINHLMQQVNRIAQLEASELRKGMKTAEANYNCTNP